MIGVGGRLTLWHIMKGFGAHGITDFVVCCGYRGYVIKDYFVNYFLHMSDVALATTTNQMEFHQWVWHSDVAPL
jgi:glucose-1-phosphate cytidylyltransferase